jgi:hypothetical protein
MGANKMSYVTNISSKNKIQPIDTRYEEFALKIGQLVDKKQAAYGDSFNKVTSILKILFPDGVLSDKYDDILAIARILDKIFRIANQKEAFNESPYEDIAGYALLGAFRDRQKKEMK